MDEKEMSPSQLSSDRNRERTICCFSRILTKFLPKNNFELFLYVLNSIYLAAISLTAVHTIPFLPLGKQEPFMIALTATQKISFT